MNIDGIKNGIVLDHIKSGRSMDIYHYLQLEKLDCCVAIIKNVRSTKMGRKDIMKIDSEIELNLDVLGFIDPNITVNIIKDGKLLEKRHLETPTIITNVLRCKNPRCITSTEQEIDHVFRLVDKENKTYRCVYCESKNKDEID